MTHEFEFDRFPTSHSKSPQDHLYLDGVQYCFIEIRRYGDR